ncbi:MULTISPECIES: phosphatidylcholine synthase [Legionella]|uniref:Phosphatidylcholine synthase n=1 Tax=Legionella septentrionalis TaxID=2498109 RepID=A0A433JHN5_9GAMM|nr:MULTISPECIES: CDP-alcohol phosphatidyltransferase family protein [Legionella]MCP0913267.1 phosphatidylcholine synthase [Legionella sp. 27cVA30]RUQ82082.1 phosphatidylcholine synthase [Legionella septentrionalis]RUQ95539.1 phosphatidylcholine synthase [Legionella septentrionalis]RUR08938.1 phosphatidylcholine synthase [Legionella septentrionalis]RUR14723.1 phosphatidylcholine synthase [Legionella septentrionalis]
MNNKKKNSYFWHFIAWSVHVFTASAAFIGLLSLYKIFQHEYIDALCLMAITVFIDAVDGTFARLVGVKEILPQIDGALLDNIVDYLNYVITPAFFLLVKPGMLPENYAYWIVLAVTITSSYQFCQADAKTADHFFKGFPCYWNFVVFYMFIFNTNMYTNTLILLILSILIFVPIKYVYPSRLDYLTESKTLKIIMHTCSLLFGISSILLLWQYPYSHPLWLTISLGYVAMYLILSGYRTYSPMIMAKIAAHKD